MVTYFRLAFCALLLSGTLLQCKSNPVSPSNPSIDPSIVNIIYQAIQESTNIASHAFGLADELPETTDNVTILCFIGPRTTPEPVMTRLREDRQLLDVFYNYTKLVNDEMCAGPEENYTLCVDVIEALKQMQSLKSLLDRIIASDKGETEEEGSGEIKNGKEYDDDQCWNTSREQMYWSFNSLGAFMDTYVKKDLEELKSTKIYK